jgi:hypothetical protein
MFLSSSLFAQHKFWDLEYKSQKSKAELSVLTTFSVVKSANTGNLLAGTYSRDITSLVGSLLTYGITKGLEYNIEKYYFDQSAVNKVVITRDTLTKIALDKNFGYYLSFSTYFYPVKKNQKTLAQQFNFRIDYLTDKNGVIISLNPDDVILNFVPVKVSRKHNVVYATFNISLSVVCSEGTKEFDPQAIQVVIVYGDNPVVEVYGKAFFPVGTLKDISNLFVSISLVEKNPYKQTQETALDIIKTSPIKGKDLLKLL